MRILHVNDVSSVGSLLCEASDGRDLLYQPALRKNLRRGALGSVELLGRRLVDVVRLRRLGGADDWHVHVHYATFAHLAEAAGLPFSLHVHGADLLLDRAHRVKRALVDRALARAIRVVVSTPDLLEATRSFRSDAVYVPNPMPLGACVARRPGTRTRLLVLSKMDRLKGWPEQVALLEQLHGTLRGLEIEFFNEGQLPADQRAVLSDALARIGACRHSFMPRREFIQWMRGFDVALGQLEVGSLGMSEMEAMAQGIPVIAEVSAHRALGLFPPTIPPDVLEIRRIVERDGDLREVGLAGRAYIASVHDPCTVRQELESHMR